MTNARFSLLYAGLVYWEEVNLSDDPAGYLLEKPYRPLLARLLRAYQACPMPAATARSLAQALHTSAVAPCG